MYLRLGLSCFIIILYLTSTTLAKSNGAPGPPRPGPRHHKRRAIGLSEFLTPPALPIQRNRPPPQLSQLQHSAPNVPYRHGKILNSLPPLPPPLSPQQQKQQQQHQHPIGTTESPGYFSQFMSWLNPFSGRSHLPSLPTPPLPPSRPPPPPPPSHNYNQNIHNGELKPPPLPQGNQYKPPPEHNLPKPPSPPTGQSYLPPLKGESCDTCNTLPWIPLPQAANIHQTSSLSKSNSPHINENIDLRAPSPSYEVKPPDFGYGLPPPQNEIIPQASNSHQNIDAPNSQMQYTSVYTGPIPNPHLYPGAIPPLFKATPFNSQEAPSSVIPEVNNGQTSAIIQQSISGTYHGQTNSNQHQSQSISVTSVSEHSNLGDGYVDSLPPSAEVISGPDDFVSGQSQEIHHDNGGSSSNFEHVLHPNESGEPSTASIQPIIDASVPTEYPQVINYSNNAQQNNYGTTLSSDGEHIIHIEESPIIDLTRGDGKSNDASASSSQSSPVIEETSVILQNPDGTYGINATIPHSDDSSYIRWPLDSETEFDSTTLTSILSDIREHGNNNQRPTIGVDGNNVKTNEQVISQESTRRNISSLLLGVFQNTDNLTEHKENVYGTHSNNINVNTHEKHLEINSELHSGERHPTTTEEPFLEALVKSHREFQRQEAEAKRQRLRLDPRELHLGAGFAPSFGLRHRDDNERLVPVQTQNVNGDQADRQTGGKRNKQVQIIIPYTSQYTPSPFHPSRGYDVSKEVDKTRGRKVPEFTNDDLVEDTRNGGGDRGKLSHIIQALNSWPKVKDATAKLSNVKANTSIDVLRLQKNIDNWTIQEYSRGTTVSTVSPISLHPHLSRSKQIPDEYFTTTEPVSISGTIREIEETYGNVLAGFNYNDLEHEVSASSRVDSPSIRVSSFEREDPSMSSELDSTTTPTTNSLSGEEDSWEQLPVSISPLSNERVYVVTPQSVSISSRINNSTKNITEENITENPNNNSTEEIVSNDRAYQVLPEAVNNLANVSTGPGTIPLWGIMEHEQYALASDKSNVTSQSPILYSGHSKVSHTKQ